MLAVYYGNILAGFLPLFHPKKNPLTSLECEQLAISCSLLKREPILAPDHKLNHWWLIRWVHLKCAHECGFLRKCIQLTSKISPLIMSIFLPSLVWRKWNVFRLSRAAISSHEWPKVTSGWKWHRMSNKNHWFVLTNQWRWTMSFS